VFTIAPPLLEHQGNFVLHAKKDATKVSVDDPVPHLLREFRSGCFLLFDTCIVEGDVKTSEGLDGPVQNTSHIPGLRHVAPDGKCSSAEFLDHVRRFPVALLRRVGDHHAGALACERQRRRTADATLRPGYERNLSLVASVLIRCHVLLSTLLIVSSVDRSHALPKPKLLLDKSPDYS
jgi:hypothetical protein